MFRQRRHHLPDRGVARELWEQLQATATICYPLEDFAYGMREFAIYDNNGYILQFGEVIEEGTARQDTPAGDGTEPPTGGCLA